MGILYMPLSPKSPKSTMKKMRPKNLCQQQIDTGSKPFETKFFPLSPKSPRSTMKMLHMHQQQSKAEEKEEQGLIGGTWIEILVMLPRRDKKKGRSLFYDPSTQKGVWFEPPPNAEKVILRKEIIPLAKKSSEEEKEKNDKEEKKDAFIPRKSSNKKMEGLVPTGDGDTWIEIVVNMIQKSNESKKRSLFYSVKTQIGVWDEPPTGASTIILHKEVKALVG